MNTTTQARRISVEEQVEMGIRNPPAARSNFVPAAPRRANLPAATHQQVSFDVTPSAQQFVQVNTSMVDRARGYHIAITPLAVVVGVLAVIVSVAVENDFFSFATFCFFWVTFAGVWLIGWGATLLTTPEAVSFYEAHRKWDIIEREQDERWKHWNSINGGGDQ